MGFGKYTKDERKIVEKINKLLQKKVYHRRMLEEINIKFADFIIKLDGKYQKKE